MNKLIKKVFSGVIREVDTDRKLVETVMSDETLDRYDEIILASAYKKTIKQFMKHAVLLSSHRYGDLRSQIGEWLKVWIDNNQLVGLAKYYVGEGNPEADWGFKLAEKGIAAYSVGFREIDADTLSWDEWQEAKKAGKKVARRTYKEVELLETSQVIIPANPSALQRSLEDEADAYHDMAVNLKSAFVDKELEALLGNSEEIAKRFLIQVKDDIKGLEECDHVETDIADTKKEEHGKTETDGDRIEEASTEKSTDGDVEVKTDDEAENVESVSEVPVVDKTDDEEGEMKDIKELITQLSAKVDELASQIREIKEQTTKSTSEIIGTINLRTVLPESSYVEDLTENDSADTTDIKGLSDIMSTLDGIGEALKQKKLDG